MRQRACALREAERQDLQATIAGSCDVSPVTLFPKEAPKAVPPAAAIKVERTYLRDTLDRLVLVSESTMIRAPYSLGVWPDWVAYLPHVTQLYARLTLIL
ncbi:hypothetical protein GCM10007874_59720 [Labrys miyagiensis]|uniref:Uncharacterized protein n=1 Tax=Labrys miyagiensis TaxID=346912 RepID=A0ABQ6CRL0_9HYPH|nr:hypothetical protein GCM10007874_59720 [Labrys miyagiensis]